MEWKNAIVGKAETQSQQSNVFPHSLGPNPTLVTHSNAAMHLAIADIDAPPQQF
jgi:hypothetical protein